MAEFDALSADDPLRLPQRPRGRLTAVAQAQHECDLDRFTEALKKEQSRFGNNRISVRGWCYLLEQHGLMKGDFPKAQRMINDFRKEGRLPVDFTASDEAREPDGLIYADGDAGDHADSLVDEIRGLPEDYQPFDVWTFSRNVYIEMLVEKVDLRTLFADTCRTFQVPISNSRGWADINSRAAMMQRFRDREAQGLCCVLLYCGDFDPGGLHISDTLRANFEELAKAVGWHPDNLIVDRFGLNLDFIQEHSLSWIDNLETGSGERLDDPKHKDHFKPYVQDYLRRYGARKVEANALVTQPDAARKLCREAILRYLPVDVFVDYTRAIAFEREKFASTFARRLAAEFGGTE
ncbi:hypothetical protein [Paraburkholderia saeva]|uniref:hypothetical protein n=1 Tax=Paraburkholderia saeva TaxID=2777537 RepID=UPI001DBB2675|nr:hypothetical protein [Paraburkholderia saeva]CAG4900280.1 hypothetical protein R52603_02720 [Paraburkholderia saeva]